MSADPREDAATPLSPNSTRLGRHVDVMGPAGPRPVQPSFLRCRKGGLLGAGADGKVFRAVNTETGEVFALKEMLLSSRRPQPGKGGSAQDDEQQMVRFLRRQIDSLKRLPAHPHVVHHYGAERTTTALHIVMECVTGGSLASVLRRLGGLDEGAVRHFTRHICEGLRFLHANGVIHRDIKGANCLLTREGTLKVADFGCCIITDPTLGGAKYDGAIRGTSMWMAPEAITLDGPLTPKADVWSLACTVVEMATGRVPWHGANFTNEWAAMFHISQCGHGPPVPRHLSRQAHAFLQRCFAVDPAQRPSAEECLALPFLAEEFRGDDPAQRPPTPSEPEKGTSLGGLTGSVLGASERESSDTCASSDTYPSIRSFAVYDHELGDAETFDDDNELSERQADLSSSASLGSSTSSTRQATRANLGAVLNLLAASEGDDGPEVARGPRSLTVTGVPSSAPLSLSAGSLVPHTIDNAHPSANPPAMTSNVSGSHGAVSLVPVPMAGVVADVDEFGLRLPEAVVLSIVRFLDATAVCRVSAVSPPFAAVCAREDVWEALFEAAFGPVDIVHRTLRVGWRTHYRRSTEARREFGPLLLPCSSGPSSGLSVAITRQLGQSPHVFEGRDADGAPVVLKVERWPRTHHVQPMPLGARKLPFGSAFIRAASPATSSVGAETPKKRLPSRGPLPTTPHRSPCSPGTPLREPDRAGLHLMLSPVRIGSTPQATGSGRPPLPTSSRPPDVTSPPVGPSESPLTAVGCARPPLMIPTRKSPSTAPTAVRRAGKAPVVGAGPSRASVSGAMRPTHVRPKLAALRGGPSAVRSPSTGPAADEPKLPFLFLQPRRSVHPTTPPAAQSRPTVRHDPQPDGRNPSPVRPLKQMARRLSPVKAPLSPERPPTQGHAALAPAHAQLHPPPSAGPVALLSPLSPMKVASPATSPVPPMGSLSPLPAAERPRVRDMEIYEFHRAYDMLPVTVATTRPDRSLLQHQVRLLRHLEFFNARSVPRVRGIIECEEQAATVLVTDALGPSIHELLLFCGNQFSLPTVLRLGSRIVAALEEVHERDVVHGSITPRNVVMGRGERRADPLLVNFSQGHFFRNPKTHRPNTTGTTSITAERARKTNEFSWFCSKFVQERCTPAPRDDLISAGYVLCYALFGGLPWMAERRLSRAELLEHKERFNEQLPAAAPDELRQYFRAAHGLRQNEIPDYPYFKGLFDKALQQRHADPGAHYDWSPLLA